MRVPEGTPARATYTGLPGGSYRLQLRAEIPGIAPRVVATGIDVSVGRSWYEYWWVRALALAGTRLGVVSAAAAGSVHTDMNALGLDDIWDSVDAPAPDKIAVLRARRGNETHAYYFGDTVYDMQSARAAGYTPIAVDRGYTDTGILRQAGATAVLTTFDELPSVLAHPMTTTQRR